MLLRTSSNPSMLIGATSSSGLKGVEMESPPSHLSKPFSSHPLVHLGTVEQNGGQWDFEGDVVPWPQFRKAQSENDLQKIGRLCAFPARFVAENFTMHEQRIKSFKTPQKQWSRRTSLRRHSSLPTIASSSDILEQILPPLPDVVETSSDTEEENPQIQSKRHKNVEHEETRQMGDASVSGRWESRCFKDQDGEVYSGVSKDADGNTLLCSSKGCRPLHESEKVVPMFMAGDLGSDHGVGLGNAHAYFRTMLDTNPGEPLLLRNYARYLYEVLHDHSKAEEYYERAILANPNEGELLAEYAKLEWELHGDEERAGNYFDQAVQAAPDNCYVLGAYAAFMWACEEKGAEKKQASFEKKFERYATAVA